MSVSGQKAQFQRVPAQIGASLKSGRLALYEYAPYAGAPIT